MSLTQAPSEMSTTSVVGTPNSYIPSEGWVDQRGPRALWLMNGEIFKIEGLPFK